MTASTIDEARRQYTGWHDARNAGAEVLHGTRWWGHRLLWRDCEHCSDCWLRVSAVLDAAEPRPARRQAPRYGIDVFHDHGDVTATVRELRSDGVYVMRAQFCGPDAERHAREHFAKLWDAQAGDR